MMKFKKFLAAAMTGAMMFGMVATAAPAVSTYAGTSVKSETPETTIFYSAVTETNTPSGGAITAEYYCDSYEEGIPYLVIKQHEVKGNYITVAYYGKPDGAEKNSGLKSSVVYTKDELREMSWMIPLTGLNLKSGASFKVYGENNDDAKPVVIQKQDSESKVKVKVKDFTKDTLLEVMEIKVGASSISADAKYVDKLFINGMSVIIEEDDKAVENPEILPELKKLARLGGGTFYLKYFPSTDDKNYSPVEAKFKISAAPKAPKVTIDYVNGAYTIPAKTSYVIAKVDENGVIPPTVTPTVLEKKGSLLIQDIVSGSAVTGSTGYAIIVESAAKGSKMGSTIVLKVPTLKELTVGTPSNNEAKLTFDGKEVGTITYTEDGVKIKASTENGLAYWNNSKSKFETVKNTKETKVIALKENETLRVKVLGTKTKGKEGFGSAEGTIEYFYVKTENPSDDE